MLNSLSLVRIHVKVLNINDQFESGHKFPLPNGRLRLLIV